MGGDVIETPDDALLLTAWSLKLDAPFAPSPGKTSCLPRRVAGDRLYDVLDLGDAAYVAFNPTIYASFVDAIGHDGVTRERAVEWIDRMIGTPPPGEFACYPAEKAAGGKEARELDERDAATYDAFVGACPADELAASGIEPEHALVVGAFDGETLAAIASAHPWHGDEDAEDAPIWDVRVIARPDLRRKGFATSAAAAAIARILSMPRIPQLRIAQGEGPAMALATRLGFIPMASWLRPSPES
jgi:hypothetical protein